MTTAAVYLRISRDDEGLALGIERQRQDCHKVAEREGWTVREFVENDVSASTNSTKPRPQYKRMLADVRSGEVGAVIAYSNSRLTRRPQEWLDLLDLYKETKVQFRTVASGTADLSTADGRAVAMTIAVWDAAEAERISERVLRKHAQMRDDGVMVGARSFGWKADVVGERVNPKTGEVVPVYKTRPELEPVEAEHLRHAAREVIAGRGLMRVAQAMNAEGLRTTRGGEWTHQNLRLALLNPKIAGLRAHQRAVVTDAQGEPVRGRWEPILSVEDWEKVVALIDAKKNRRDGSTRHLLGGLARCADCDVPLYGSHFVDYKSKKPLTRYTCDKCRLSISGDKLEDKVLNLTVGTLLMGVFDEPEKGPEASIKARLSDLQAQDGRLLDLAQSGVYSASEVASRRAGIREEIEEIQREFATQAAKDAEAGNIMQIRNNLWDLEKFSWEENGAPAVDEVREALIKMDFEQLRAVIRGCVSIRVARGRGDDRMHVEQRVPIDMSDAMVMSVAGLQ